MKNYPLFLWQLLTYILLGLPLRFLLRVNVRSDFVYKPGMCYIFAANHPQRIDPFVILYAFPLRELIHVMPVRIITAERYMSNPFLFPFLVLFGGITTRTTRSGSVLERSIRLLNRGESIFIFPSGKLEKQGVTVTPKVGVAYLGKHVTNACVVPIKISYKRASLSGVTVLFKKSLVVDKRIKNLQNEAERIYRIIKS